MHPSSSGEDTALSRQEQGFDSPWVYQDIYCMERIHLDNSHSVGLGDNLCLISLLANVKEPVELLVDDRHETYEKLSRYKQIFMIPDSKLTITKSATNGDFKNTGWPLKLTMDYYRAPQVLVNGQILDTVTERDSEKRCIAVAAFYDDAPEDSKNEWPWCKRRDLAYWSEIFAYFKSLHYDVITVDRHMFDLENKIEAMVKNCKAVVSYEGGMAHLAHMLNIPVFLVDWTYPTPSTNLDRFHCEFVHRSKSMYLLRDDRELLSWNEDKFNRVVYELTQGKTNNRLLNGEYRLEFEGPGVYGRIKVKDRQGNTALKINGLYDIKDTASNFIDRHAGMM
jgi:hypothetical protein